MKTTKKLWIGLLILIILSPLGLILPAKFSAGSAWGEWSTQEIHEMVGYVPAQMGKLADRWHAPMPDYALKDQENASIQKLSFSYIASALVGVGVVVGIALLAGKLLSKDDK